MECAGRRVTLREATRLYGRQPSGSPIGRFEFDWREETTARDWDRDMLDLLNLLWPDDHYPTATVIGRGERVACERTPRLLVVGDSFLREFTIATMQAPCPPRVDYWFYRRADDGAITLGRYDVSRGEPTVWTAATAGISRCFRKPSSRPTPSCWRKTN